MLEIFVSSHRILTSSVICYGKEARQGGIYFSISKAVDNVFMHFDWLQEGQFILKQG